MALAKSYVEETLAEKLDINTLQEFFGEFDQIKVLSQNSEVLVALVKNKTNALAKGRLFELKLSGGRILDIQEKD